MGEQWGSAATLERFGLQSDIDSSGLGADAGNISVPVGKSPYCYNVIAYPGRVASRPGFTRKLNFSSEQGVSFSELVLQDAVTRLILILNDAGNLTKETGSYAPVTLVAANITEASLWPTTRMNSTTLFGRQYMAFATNGLSGAALPLAYDNTNLYQVAPPGPGDIVTAMIGATQVAAGSISAGTHNYRLIFRTRWGFLTGPSPSMSFTSTGGMSLDITDIPTGPSYVTERIFCATAADDGDYYYIPFSSMVIPNNTATTARIDFADDVLLAGQPVSVQSDPDTDLCNLMPLSAQGSVFSYHSRLCWLGERNTYQSFSAGDDSGLFGMQFNGGFIANIPCGWNHGVAGYAKGTGVSNATGDYLQITGNGAAQRGMLQNMGVPLPIIPAGVEVRARVRIRKSTGTTGTFHVLAVQAYSDAATVNIQNLSIDASTLSDTEWRVIDGQMLSAVNNTLTRDSRIRISGGGSGLGTVVSNGGIFYIDYLELYPGTAPYQPSLARWSKALQPDAYDAVQGYQYVEQDNGERLTCGFVIGDVAYFCKERSLYSTRDDGAREPAFWGVSEVSSNVGTPSSQGVGIGDQWVAIAGRAGLYYFDGGKPILLSNDFRNTWKSINWQYGNMVTCRVDMDRKLILVAAPLSADTTPKTILVFQWFGDSPVSSGVEPTTWTTVNNWPILDMGTAERPDGTRQFLLSTGTATGGNALVMIDDTAHVDTSGTTYAIPSLYQTAFFGDSVSRKLVGAVRASLRGSGVMQANLVNMAGGTIALPSVTLAGSPIQEREFPVVRFVGERVAIQITTSASGAWFSLEKLAALYREKEATPQRGREA